MKALEIMKVHLSSITRTRGRLRRRQLASFACRSVCDWVDEQSIGEPFRDITFAQGGESRTIRPDVCARIPTLAASARRKLRANVTNYARCIYLGESERAGAAAKWAREVSVAWCRARGARGGAHRLRPAGADRVKRLMQSRGRARHGLIRRGAWICAK